MNKTLDNTNPVKEEKEMTEAAQLSNPTVPEPNKVPNEDKTEETSTESLKALQKEVAEKEQQINQQLEILWASGTNQMLGDHDHQQTTSDNPLQTTQKILPLEPQQTMPPTTQKINESLKKEENHNVPMLEENHEIILKKQD